VKKIEKKMDDVLAPRLENKRAIHRWRIFSDRMTNLITHIDKCLFSIAIKDKTKISFTIKILHLGQSSFTRKVRTIFTLKIIVSIFVKLFLILVLHFKKDNSLS
jgi:hypothetical protein